LEGYNFPDGWPAPSEHLTEVGRISVLFGMLESSVNLSISKLSGYDGALDWRSAVVTAHSNFKQRIDILETLCHELKDDYSHLSNYLQVIKIIRKVQRLRNKYAHNAMSVNPESGIVETSYLSARGKMKPVVEEVTIHELREVSAQIHIAMIDLHLLITQVKYEPIWER